MTIAELPGTRAETSDIVTSVSDPDPDWIWIQLGQWIRIWIRIQDDKNDPQK